MKQKPGNTNTHRQKEDNRERDNLQGYPTYPPDEDIYGKYQKESSRNPEDPSNIKKQSVTDITGKFNEMDFDDDVSGADLDIPGSELDDELEFIGSEDEENNYYSLGGDDHNDLEED